jgi:hypothetical protein
LEEIHEIHDEWREQITLHEELVGKFQAMYETSSLPFCEFLETVWWEKMKELLKSHNPPSQEEISRVRELGIILDEVEASSSQDEVTRLSRSWSWMPVQVK